MKKTSTSHSALSRTPARALLNAVAMSAATACASFGAVSIASAQTAATPTPTLAPVTVTANRVEQDLQSAPFAALVLTDDQIRASGALDANDAIRRLTGIPSRTDLRGGRNYSLDLRGFGATADQNVVVVIDGIRISENELATARLSAISPEMIESIEIIRGGASVQWGEGASAGVINVVLKHTGAPGVHGSGSVGIESNSGRDVRAQLNVGVGTTLFDLNLRNYDTDGYRDNEKNQQQTASVGVSGKAGGFGFRARITSEDEKSRFPGPLTFAQYTANPRQTLTPDDFGNYNETRVNAGIDYKLGNVTFALDVGQRDRHSAGYFVGSSFSSSSKSDVTQLSPKVTYAGQLGASALTVVGGMDFEHWRYHSIDNFGQDEHARQTNNAAYVTGDLLLPTGTRLTAGTRHEKVNKKSTDPANFVNYDRTDDVNSWELGVNQDVGAGVNIYARGAQAFRLPNVDENRFLVLKLQPQITKDLEAGVKWQSTAGYRASASVFRQKATNEISYDPTVFANVNLDPTQRKGVELTADAPVTSALTLKASLQMVDAKFSSGPNNGKEIPLVSKTSAAVRLDWQIDARQRAGIGAQYQSDARFGNDNANTCSNRIPSHTYLDARYSWTLDRLELSIAADNLTDRKTYSQAFSCLTGSIYPDPGRVIRATVKYSF